MTKTPTATTTRTVTVLARSFVKATRTVIYRVRNGQQHEYNVSLHKSGNTPCTCKHGEVAGNHAHCYHVTHCQALELERKAVERAAYVAEFDPHFLNA